MGLLDQLSKRQEDYRGLVRDLRLHPEDKTLGMVASDGIDEDALVNVASVLFELSDDPAREIKESDILWAAEFVDHLDTLGMEVKWKSNATST